MLCSAARGPNHRYILSIDTLLYQYLVYNLF